MVHIASSLINCLVSSDIHACKNSVIICREQIKEEPQTINKEGIT